MADQKSPEIINLTKWIEINKNNFMPPVCNKLMHNGQLVVMLVGGPNQREDYHIEEGEEIFYQLKGDMCVKIIENNKHKDVFIKEGEFFILPARVPHSPQRFTNTIGLVIERKRTIHEVDAVRWFVPEKTNVLYEKWFHCKDLGIELIPLIRNYFASDEYKTKQPGLNIEDKIPYELNNELIQKDQHGPFNLKEKLSSNNQTVINLTASNLNLQFDIKAFKCGEHKLNNSDLHDRDIWFMQVNGNCNIMFRTRMKRVEDYCLNLNDTLLVPENYCEEINIKVNDNSCLLKFTQKRF